MLSAETETTCHARIPARRAIPSVAAGGIVLRLEAEISDIRLNLDGIYAILFGLPVLALACLIIGFMLFFPARRFLKTIAIVLSVPSLLLGLALMTDALALSGGAAGYDTLNIIFMAAYFALLGLLPCLLFIQVRRKPPEAQRDGKAPSA